MTSCRYLLFLCLGSVLVACTREYPLSEFDDFQAKPVLNGYMSEKYGLDLLLTKTLSPINTDTISAVISNAEIFLLTAEDDTIFALEEDPGRYTNPAVHLRKSEVYELYATVPDYENIVIRDLIIPEIPAFISLSLDSSRLQEGALRFALQMEGMRLEEYWYWFRFTGDLQPIWTDLDNTQLYDICQANNYSSSNQIIFSTACSSDGKMHMNFESHFGRREIPTQLEVEIVCIESTFGQYLRELSELRDLDQAFREPPPPISNSSIGIGYVAPISVFDTTFVLY